MSAAWASRIRTRLGHAHKSRVCARYTCSFCHMRDMLGLRGRTRSCEFHEANRRWIKVYTVRLKTQNAVAGRMARINCAKMHVMNITIPGPC